MGSLFNRKIVFSTYSQEECKKAQEVLSQNKISFKYKSFSSNCCPGARNTVGVDVSTSSTFYLTVSKDDYDRATECLRPMIDAQ